MRLRLPDQKEIAFYETISNAFKYHKMEDGEKLEMLKMELVRIYWEKFGE
mgnify:CR=1 FL=1